MEAGEEVTSLAGRSAGEPGVGERMAVWRAGILGVSLAKREAGHVRAHGVWRGQPLAKWREEKWCPLAKRKLLARRDPLARMVLLGEHEGGEALAGEDGVGHVTVPACGGVAWRTG